MTVFPIQTVDRSLIHWEDFCESLTPVERRGDTWFKRDDMFAPLGTSGPNGGKLRSYVYLFANAIKNDGVVSGATARSPQLPSTALVAKHFGKRMLAITGGTAAGAFKNPDMELAIRLGAEFIFNSVGYHRALQSRVEREALSRGWWPLVTPIGPGLDGNQLAALARLGGRQVSVLPDVDTLVVPAGSCITASAILFGLAKYGSPIRNVHLVGVGPSKLAWLNRRLALLETVTDSEILSHFRGELGYGGGCNVVFHDLHSAGVRYDQLVPWSYEGIDFHPTYEGKMMRYLSTDRPDLLEGTCVWIVGAKFAPGNMGLS